MSFSRFSVLAVFLMMVMSAFVAVPTYNVGADDHEGDGPYLNAFPTGGSGDPSDYEMSVDVSEGGANITVEATELVENTTYRIDWNIEDWDYNVVASDSWDISQYHDGYREYFIGQEVFDELGTGCYFFIAWLADDTQIIETEDWPFTLDLPFSACDDGPDEGDCPFDDREGSPCEDVDTNPCREDHESDECWSYVESYCEDNDDPGCFFGDPSSFVCGNGDVIPFVWVNDGEEDCEDGSDEQQYDDFGDRINWFDCHDGSEIWIEQVNNGVDDCYDGEDEGYGGDDYDDEGPQPENFHAAMTMESLEDWMVDLYAEMPVDWSNDMREDVSGMCADMLGTDGGEITEDCFDHWMDMFMEDGHDGEHHEDECPPGLTDEQCNALRDCFENSSDSGMLSCWRMMYDICVDDDSFEFCNEDEDREFFNNIFAYEDGLMDAEDFMSAVIDEIDGDGDYNEPAIYDYQHFTINEGDEGIYRLHSEFFPGSTPNFICGDGTEVPFSYVNDGYEDCEDGADEQQYEEGDNTTKINWFDCHDGSEVWIDQVNNGDWDCEDGEDEYQVYYWWGRAYLIDGHQNSPDEFTHNLITGAGYHCGWKDADEVEVDCSEYAEAYLSAGNYTLLTTGTCYDEWTDEDEDGEDDFNMLSCNNHGHSNHTLKNIDGVVHNFHSEIEPWDFVEETLMEMTEEYWDNEWHGSSNFPLYDTYSFVLDTSVDGDVTITSSQWQCYDWDEDGEDDDCWGTDLALYLYEESFDPADPHANIIASNDDYYDDNFDCPSEGGDCSQSALQVILNQGVTYVVVTAGYGTWDEGFYLNNIISEGDIIESWDGELLPSHYAWNDTTNESYVVPGDDRANLPYPWEYETGGDDEEYEFYMSILDIIDAYESGEMDASESADAFVDLMYEADEAGLFSDDDYEDAYEDDHEEHEDDEDENPALLDGIVGVNDPEDPNLMPTPENMIGDVSDNEGSPLFMGSFFKVHFDGVDESLETHELYIPIADDGEDWYAEIFFLEGYELISCDVCEDLEIDGNEAKFRTDSPVIITFGMVEPLPDCDHVIGLDSTGYAFEPADLTINVGETVCWQWEGAADVHNVLELESEFDEDMNLTSVSVGFFSGEPSNTVDFRHTFTEDDMTHYYVCEPHATMGMVGKITVGEGSDEDPVEEIVEEAGLPSVGFVVSVLALIGVTGLRRRIH